MTVDCVVRQRTLLGESPLWDPRAGFLYWLDLRAPTIFRLDPAGGGSESWVLDLPPVAGCLVLTDRGLLLAHMDRLFHCDFATRQLTPWIAANHRPRETMFNDGKVDRAGRFWLGSSDRNETAPLGSLYRIDAAGQAAIADQGFACANGPAFSPDGGRLYFSDSMVSKVYAYELDPAGGALGPRHLFAEFSAAEGYPDGMTVDAEGGIWICHWGGWRVTRFSPEGRRERVIEMPAPFVTSCAFAGPELRDLYITTASAGMSAEDEARAPLAGSLFCVTPGVAGLAEPVFRPTL